MPQSQNQARDWASEVTGCDWRPQHQQQLHQKREWRMSTREQAKGNIRSDNIHRDAYLNQYKRIRRCRTALPTQSCTTIHRMRYKVWLEVQYSLRQPGLRRRWWTHTESHSCPAYPRTRAIVRRAGAPGHPSLNLPSERSRWVVQLVQSICSSI